MFNFHLLLRCHNFLSLWPTEWNAVQRHIDYSLSLKMKFNATPSLKPRKYLGARNKEGIQSQKGNWN